MYRAVFACLAFVAVTPAAHAFAAQTDSREPARIFTVVNTSFDSVVALAFAPAGSEAFEEVALGEPLHGGLTSAAVEVPVGACMRDVRATFRNGKTYVFPAVDVCRNRQLRLSAKSQGG
ncbi:hypothetical protein FHW69_002879 [Luteibacter sp. Sphag1AF]|uniref:hypothetical protein n=1 Tax=Luteibacter sp. Sphag1AF TaxID=2587031 RepID=UPI001621E73A|nr:hypothetical protein [Luteibacter sp. Sphag1AF]MBB3228244.1 hypothetical protein [Luteibacter sp. Sphag1AF]